MLLRTGWVPCVLLLAFALGCAAEGTREAATSLTASPAATAATAATTTVTASPMPQAARGVDIRVSRLAIPSLGIDAEVQPSFVVPDTSLPTPGCPAPPPGSTTFTVPERGIATPVEEVDGLENKAWIFGHSRWQGQPGVFFRLQELNMGDELIVDGVDRRTGEQIKGRRFLVSGLYLTDIDAGGKLVTAGSPREVPAKPVVILQTSVREDGASKPWILDRRTIEAKSRNLIEGDVNDPCKYLLLFVFAQAS